MQRKRLGMIMFTLTFTFIGFGIIIPVMPEIVSSFHLNLMLTLYSAASFIMSPIWGALSDRIGRKPVMLTGLIGFGVSFLAFALAVDIADSLFALYAARILAGLFSGALTSVAVAYVADVTSEEERTKGMGLVGMSIGFGFIIGPGVGGLTSIWGLSVPFYLSAALSLITFIVVSLKLTESLAPENRKSVHEKRPSRWTAFTGRIKYLYVIAFFVSFTLAGLEGTLQYFQMDRIGITPRQMGIMFLASGIVGALIQGGVVRRMVKKGSESKVAVIGLLLCAAGFGLLLLSSNLWNAVLFLCVFSSGNALIRPCVTSLITQKTTVAQGVTSGLSSSMDSLGRIAGPLFFGSFLFHIEMVLPYLIGAMICIAATAFIFRFNVLDRRHEATSRAQ